ncbi:MAG: lipase maturation factor family protein [bacterium]|nr:lipase maturation factor family protein [bacterium]
MGSEQKLEKPVLIYDGHCGFCKRWAEVWREWTGHRVEYIASQKLGERFPDLPREWCEDSVVYVDEAGNYYQNSEAVFRSLQLAPGKEWLLPLYHKVPGFAFLSDWFYRRVANNRMFFSKITRWYAGKDPSYRNYFIARRVFLLCLGIIYLVAFSSLGSQVSGLLGEQGILPAGEFLQFIRERYSGNPYLSLPTLFWIQSGDLWLQSLCWLGAFMGLLMALGWGGPLVSFLAWYFYLSLYLVGQSFLGFQWDILLLETGFLAIFLSPWSWGNRNAIQTRPSVIVLFLYRWLLFRLMFQSGMVKLFSGDSSWRDMTAMNYHYETQPLPNPISYWVHQLPEWVQRESTLLMLVMEIGVPFLVFFPNPIRMAAALILGCFQILIIFTGNYGFFNLLTLALCVLLIADRYWPKWLHKRILPEGYFAESVGRRYWRGWVVLPLAGVILFLSTFSTWGKMDRDYSPPDWYKKVAQVLGPYQITNSYGLFAYMTKSRPEITVEGSEDGENWKTYGFKYKPGPLKRRPPWLLGHMPRLDWQMWFASLRPPGRAPYWFNNFAVRLLEGSQPVLDLLEDNPFPDKPPKYIRATVANYYFSNPELKRETGEWWIAGPEKIYFPARQLIKNP